MRVNPHVSCVVCGEQVTVYLYNSLKKTNEKCLPAWTKCNCGWLEISTLSLDSLVPEWREYFAEDVDEIDENISFDDALAEVKQIVEELTGEKL